MATTIEDSVGIHGRNLPDDVVAVQTHLNRIVPVQGGPTVKLDPDGKAGPKTNHAIQMFQLEHFGWKGADGRVDPNGPTLAKLNELTRSGPAEPPGTDVSGSFVIRQATSAPVLTNPDNDFFFLVEDGSFRHKVRYIFTPIGRPLPFVIPTNFPGNSEFFAASPPVSIFALGGPAFYVTISGTGAPQTFLQFTGPQLGTRVLPLSTHLPKGAGKSLGGALGKSTPTREEISGAFILG